MSSASTSKTTSKPSSVLDILGGRRVTLAIITIVLIALKNVLGFDDETIKQIVTVALGGVGAVAIEDVVKAFKK